MRSPWRPILRRLAHRARTLHAREQWLLDELQTVRVSRCKVDTRMDHVREVMLEESSVTRSKHGVFSSPGMLPHASAADGPAGGGAAVATSDRPSTRNLCPQCGRYPLNDWGYCSTCAYPDHIYEEYEA